MTKRLLLVLCFISTFLLNAQIVIDNSAPYNSTTYLINNILISGGITPTNHSFIGDPGQIGFFNGVNSNLGIDSGIVLSSGNVADLVGPNASGSTSTAYNLPGDPTLDLVVGPIDYTNDAAVLEFDFVPTSNVISFKYVFGSEEYLEFVASFNDAFGFFLSGPNPAGGMYVDQNLAIVPGTANTPVSIFNVNNVSNSAYYVDNGTGATAPQNTDPTVIQFDGFTTPLTATADVNCGDTYHIKLVVADVNDWSWDSGVFLEAGSFYSPPLDITDDLGIDSTVMNIPCNATIILTANGGSGATYQWFDSLANVISTTSSITVGPGFYYVNADILGCATFSDTLQVIANPSPIVDLGPDFMIPCNSDTLVNSSVSGGTPPFTYLWNNASTNSNLEMVEGNFTVLVTDFYGCIDKDTIEIFYDVPPTVDLGIDYMIPCNTKTTIISNVVGGTEPYTYLWNDASTDSLIEISEGNYTVLVTDFYGCTDNDEIEITVDINPSVIISGGDSICADGSTTEITFTFNGLFPWDLIYTDGMSPTIVNNIPTNQYSFFTSDAGQYGIELANDVNDCLADIHGGTVEVIVYPLPVAEVTPNDITIYVGEEIELNTGEYTYYEWYNENETILSDEQILTVTDSGRFYVWVEDEYGCTDTSEFAIVRALPLTQLFVPTVFTPNNDMHNEYFVIKGLHIVDFNIQIFARWGELIFESNSIYKSWDGFFEKRPVPEGSYFYQIEVLGKDKKSFTKAGAIQVIY